MSTWNIFVWIDVNNSSPLATVLRLLQRGQHRRWQHPPQQDL